MVVFASLEARDVKTSLFLSTCKINFCCAKRRERLGGGMLLIEAFGTKALAQRYCSGGSPCKGDVADVKKNILKQDFFLR